MAKNVLLNDVEVELLLKGLWIIRAIFVSKLFMPPDIKTLNEILRNIEKLHQKLLFVTKEEAKK